MLLHDGRPIYLNAMGELEPGTVFAGHRIESVAGRGGMGVVYRATQLALDRTVALKVIAPGLLEDQTVRNRFVRESKVAASIDHPNVIPIYYAGEEDGIAYIAMRYVAGDDVRSLVRREGQLDARAGGAARRPGRRGARRGARRRPRAPRHQARERPADQRGPRLPDRLRAHQARAVASRARTKPGHWVGTLDYVAPEQIRGERIDARADVYALGCLLFYALTGDVPFKRESDEARLWAHLSEPPPKPSERPRRPGRLRRRDRARAGEGPGGALPVRRRPRSRRRSPPPPTAGPTERERLVAKGAAAPIESPTVTAAAIPKPAARDDRHSTST